MRSKEDAQDYRYFPDPDLVPLSIQDEWIERLKPAQPELRTEKLARYKEEYEIPDYDARLSLDPSSMADIFEADSCLVQKPKKVSNWLMTETMRLLKEHDMEPEELNFSPENLATLIDLSRRRPSTRPLQKRSLRKFLQTISSRKAM